MAVRKEATVETEAEVVPLPGVSADRKARFIVVFGAGNSGKSTLQRWAVERALLAGRTVVNAEGDRAKASQEVFFGTDGVERPEFADDDAVVAWLTELIEGQAEQIADGHPTTIMLDMGGGDLVFPRFARMLGLGGMLSGAGIEPVAVHLIGPGVDDLAQLRDIEESGSFSPERTLLVCNAGLIPGTRSPGLAFKAVQADPIYRAAVMRGAREVTMPALPVLPVIDQLGARFADAAAGRVMARPDGVSADAWPRWGMINRTLTGKWLRDMEAAFGPVREYLP